MIWTKFWWKGEATVCWRSTTCRAHWWAWEILCWQKDESNFPSLKPYGPYPAIPSYHVKLVIYSRYVPIYIPIAIMSSRLDRWGRLSGHDSPAEIGNMCYLEVVAAGIQMVPLIKSVNSSSMHWGLKIPMLCLPSCSLPGSLVSCLGVWGNTAAVFAPIRRYADRCVVSVYIGAKAVYRCIMVYRCSGVRQRPRGVSIYRFISASAAIGVSVYRSEKRLVDPILQRYAHHIPIISPLNILK